MWFSIDRTVRSSIHVAAAAASIASTAVSSAAAQVDSTGRWRFYATPYGWMSGLAGDVGVGPVSVHVVVPFSEVLKVLQFAAIGGIEARRGPWLGSIDAMYVALANGKSIAIRGDTGSFDLTQRETVIQPVAGYAFGNHRWAIDVLGGARYWNLSSTLDVSNTRRPSNQRSGSRAWTDAIGGVRFRWVPAPYVHFVAGGDAGGGGSKSTWQAHAALGVEVTSAIAVGVDYRYLDVNYNHDNFLFHTHTHGPAIGATFRF